MLMFLPFPHGRGRLSLVERQATPHDARMTARVLEAETASSEGLARLFRSFPGGWHAPWCLPQVRKRSPPSMRQAALQAAAIFEIYRDFRWLPFLNTY